MSYLLSVIEREICKFRLALRRELSYPSARGAIGPLHERMNEIEARKKNMGCPKILNRYDAFFLSTPHPSTNHSARLPNKPRSCLSPD